MKGSEQPVELALAPASITFPLVMLAHCAALLPTVEMPWKQAVVVLLVVTASLLFHSRLLARCPWQRLLLHSGGSIKLLDSSGEWHPARLSGCSLAGARISILVLQVGARKWNLPVFRLAQPDAYRRFRRFMLKYPPGESIPTSTAHNKNRTNGHRRKAGSVF